MLRSDAIPDTRYPLPVARCPLPVARCPLPVARCPLPDIRFCHNSFVPRGGARDAAFGVRAQLNDDRVEPHAIRNSAWLISENFASGMRRRSWR